jgi:3D (Asp-Asp-Asp) domain-containing protein
VIESDVQPMLAAAFAWFLATAYCRDGQTRSGDHTRPGIIAADPHVIPFGSRVRVVDRGASRIYTVLDTGRQIRGRKIDVFMPSCARAKTFGERRVAVTVLKSRRGRRAARTSESSRSRSSAAR